MTAQDEQAAPPCAVQHFVEAQRKIENTKDYLNGMEELAAQALNAARSKPGTRDAEEVLQWVLDSPRSFPATMQAATLLAKHHGASMSTTEWLVGKPPREWTPGLFAELRQLEMPAEQRVIFEMVHALHDRALLDLSDEIKASKGNPEYELRLGKALTNTLRNQDTVGFEKQLIATFTQLANRHGNQTFGGATVRDLAQGAIYSIEHLRLGKTVKELTGTTVNNKTVTLDQYRGNAVIVDFWATSCAPCIHDHKFLRELKAELKGSKFAIIGVSVGETIGNTKKYVEENATDWPSIADPERQLSNKWHVLSLPTYVVLDLDHVIRYRGSSIHDATNVVKDILGTSVARFVDQMVALTLKEFDENNDQRIEKGELPVEHQARLMASDLNNDGFLSIDELTTFCKVGATATVAPGERDNQ